MARTVEFYVNRATESFSKGFSTKTAKKDALDDLNRAYDLIREQIFHHVLDLAAAKFPDFNGIFSAERTFTEEYMMERGNFINQYDLPFGLHQVREKHLEAVKDITDQVQTIRDLIELRSAIKDTEVAVREAKTEGLEQKIRRTILEEITARKEKFDVAKRIVELFGQFIKDEDGRDVVLLPINVNHVYCMNMFGSHWIRIDWYLRGKKTAFNTIMAAAEQVQREQKAQ